jgi:hypothetical protein
MNEMAYWWHYYIEIENQLVEAGRYVEIALHNKNTYSVGFAHILLPACADVEVLCRLLTRSGKSVGMTKLHERMVKKFPKIHEFETLVPRSRWSIKPFEAWSKNTDPEWWEKHNNVKHFRYDNFQDAKLLNALFALAGLLCLNLYYCRNQNIYHSTLTPQSTVFEMPYKYFTTGQPQWCPLPDFPDGI